MDNKLSEEELEEHQKKRDPIKEVIAVQVPNYEPKYLDELNSENVTNT